MGFVRAVVLGLMFALAAPAVGQAAESGRAVAAAKEKKAKGKKAKAGKKKKNGKKSAKAKGKAGKKAKAAKAKKKQAKRRAAAVSGEPSHQSHAPDLDEIPHEMKDDLPPPNTGDLTE